MREKKNHLYVDSEERKLLLHSLVEDTYRYEEREPLLDGADFYRILTVRGTG